MAHGKRYRQQYEKVQRGRRYPPAEAVSLLKQTASAKFDETVELHIRLGVNVRHAEEQLRGTLPLPHGLGKDVTIAVFAQGQKARDAEAAGADFVAVIEEIIRAKPAAAKGRYMISITLTTAMGPGIRVDPTKTRERDIIV